MLEFGTQAKDIVTGFAGVVTGRSEYSTGCRQYLLSPPVSREGSYRSGQWFDEARLTDAGTSDPGGPQANEAPKVQ